MLRPPVVTPKGTLAASRALVVMLIVVGASVWLLGDLVGNHHLWFYDFRGGLYLSLIHISEPTRPY